MDQEILVEHQLDDVYRLVAELAADNFSVSAVFWIYTSESEQWFLYLVSDEVEQKGITEAYRLLYGTMKRLTDLWIDRFEVKLVDRDDPIAEAIINFSSDQRAPLATWIRGSTIGDLYVERAFIYGNSRLAFGNVNTGKVVPACRERPMPSGGVLTRPAVPEPVDLTDWEPGVLGPDRRFHPKNHARKPAVGEWIVPPDVMLLVAR